MDYSPYYFRRDRESPSYGVGKGAYRPSPQFAGRAKTGRGTELLLVAVVLVSLIVTLALSDYYGNNAIVKNFVGGSQRRTETREYYYVSIGGYDALKDAESAARSSRLAYSAGFVFVDNGAYFVALATYLDIKSAEDVADKNVGTVVKRVAVTLTSDILADSASDTLTATIEALDVVIDDYARKQASAQETIDKLEAITGELLTEKERLYSEEKGSVLSDSLAAIDSILNFLESVIEERRADSLLAEMRYCECMAVEALR